jgi:hypothetical protein
MAAPKGNKFAKGNKGGRPTAYRPEFAERAKNLCQLGAVDVEIADFFGVTVQTIHNWRAAHQEFFEATRVGKEYADNRVERTFYQRAVGYEYDLVKTVRRNKNGLTVTETIKHVPGDVTAQMKWLCNRMPHKWRHKVDVTHEVGPEMTAAQAFDDLIAVLVKHGVQIAPPPGQTIEGEAETIGVARIDEQGAQGDKIGRCAPRPMRRARP